MGMVQKTQPSRLSAVFCAFLHSLALSVGQLLLMNALSCSAEPDVNYIALTSQKNNQEFISAMQNCGLQAVTFKSLYIHSAPCVCTQG